MSCQSTKERKVKENIVVLHNGSKYFDRSIRGKMCQVLKVPYINYYDPESKDYYMLIETNSAFNGNYIIETNSALTVITYNAKVTGIYTKIYHQKNILIL